MTSTATATAELLGGVRVLGGRVRDEMDLARMVEAGLPPQSLQALADHEAVHLDEVWRLVLPRRSIRGTLAVL